ncbi:hypothetical protein EBB07_09350 [Paenibacillaceae bacterium]|nr:hypothetical protein EBB07_09350 [Paenibacillaceae bacterium]
MYFFIFAYTLSQLNWIRAENPAITAIMRRWDTRAVLLSNLRQGIQPKGRPLDPEPPIQRAETEHHKKEI